MLFAVLGAVVVFAVLSTFRRPVTTVILVRHAEKIIDPNNADPDLSPAGEARAGIGPHVWRRGHQRHLCDAIQTHATDGKAARGQIGFAGWPGQLRRHDVSNGQGEGCKNEIRKSESMSSLAIAP